MWVKVVFLPPLVLIPGLVFVLFRRSRTALHERLAVLRRLADHGVVVEARLVNEEWKTDAEGDRFWTATYSYSYLGTPATSLGVRPGAASSPATLTGYGCSSTACIRRMRCARLRWLATVAHRGPAEPGVDRTDVRVARGLGGPLLRRDDRHERLGSARHGRLDRRHPGRLDRASHHIVAGIARWLVRTSSRLVVIDASAPPVLEVATARARASEILGHHEYADGEHPRNDDADRSDRETPGERLADRPRGADEDEANDRRLRARHATAACCTNDACCAHSPHCASSSFVTHPLRTAKRSSSRSVVCSISGPSVLKLKRTLCFLNVAM